MDKHIQFTVAQLIEKLKEFSQDMPVLTSGYETEYENILLPKLVKVIYIPDEPYYNGQYKESKKKNHESFDAVVLEREERL